MHGSKKNQHQLIRFSDGEYETAAVTPHRIADTDQPK
jgi:hypothetical protein